jgi:hypothetical protein
VHDDTPQQAIASALLISRLRAVRLQLLDVHKALIDVERARYEAQHGPIGTPQHVLKLLIEDPWFAWLRPLAQLIVQIDERLADKAPLTTAEADALVELTRSLMRRDRNDSDFHQQYRRVLQDVPAIVVMQGKLASLLDPQKE